MRFIRNNNEVKKVLGEGFQIMNCNGKEYPMNSKVQFDIVAFGDNGRGKFQIETVKNSDKSNIRIERIDLFTEDLKVKIV